jgi:hypothetical protein
MIYVLQPWAGGPVKIGFSDDVNRRRIQLEAHYGQTLALLAMIPGGRDEERAIHERFAHLRLSRTEQFQPAADLMEFIGCPLPAGSDPGGVEAIGTVKRVLVFDLPSDVYRQLRVAAAMEGRSVSDFLRRLLRKHLLSKAEPQGPE